MYNCSKEKTYKKEEWDNGGLGMVTCVMTWHKEEFGCVPKAKSENFRHNAVLLRTAIGRPLLAIFKSKG